MPYIMGWCRQGTDLKGIGPEELTKMPSFQVYYMRPEWFGEGIRYAEPDPANLDKTHIHLRNVIANDVEQVWSEQQAERWSPNGEARSLIREKGLEHTSMSVGDVVVAPDGSVHLCASIGFKRL